MEIVEVQLLISLYKSEVKNNPGCIASKHMLDYNRKKLSLLKKEKHV